VCYKGDRVSNYFLIESTYHTFFTSSSLINISSPEIKVNEIKLNWDLCNYYKQRFVLCLVISKHRF
jgi:hypothetical protein